LEKDNVNAGQYLKNKEFSLKILPYDVVVEEKEQRKKAPLSPTEKLPNPSDIF